MRARAFLVLLTAVAALPECRARSAQSPGLVDEPIVAPPSTRLDLRFGYSMSKELSCSLSFESDSTSGNYSLVLEPSGKATLSVEGSVSHSFGSSESRFKPGGLSEMTRDENGSTQTWSGSVDWRKSGFTAELVPNHSECTRLVAHKGWYTVECRPQRSLSLMCRRTTVEAFAAQGPARSASSVEVYACTPAVEPSASNHEIDFPDELLFSPAPGLVLKYWEHAIGNIAKPTLRFVRSSSQ
jgi:hypothetical protein